MQPCVLDGGSTVWIEKVLSWFQIEVEDGDLKALLWLWIQTRVNITREEAVELPIHLQSSGMEGGYYWKSIKPRQASAKHRKDQNVT